jgi:molecular chaperone HtpG
MNMERVLKVHQKYAGESKPVLEINTDHILIKRLAEMNETDGSKNNADFTDAALLLLDQARIIQGQPVKDASAFTRRMADFMQRGLK